VGTFSVRARVWNPADKSKEAVVELVVDTGATYTVLLRSLLERLGVSPVRSVRLADGRIVERPLGEVGIEVEGRHACATPVVFGDKGIYLLGSVTTAELGLAPDPVEKRLESTEALLM